MGSRLSSGGGYTPGRIPPAVGSEAKEPDDVFSCGLRLPPTLLDVAPKTAYVL